MVSRRGEGRCIRSKKGLDELTEFFSSWPASVLVLGDDAVEPFVDASYASANMPTLQSAARDQERRVLTPLLMPYWSRRPNSATCAEFSSLLTLTIYSHALLLANDTRIPLMVALTNAAYHACGSLPAAMGYDYHQKLAAEGVSTDDVWDLVMWREHHIAYIPTGYGRYPIYIANAPYLYNFLRENFYAVLEMGELDLVAEFVDLFRQYGCTEQNDLQVRDGTRYLLKLFHTAGDHWMAYRGPHEPVKTTDYDTVHKAWTGMAGVRVRVPEPAEPGTYGGIVRQWLGYVR
jgi:hypothetical protein